MTQSRGRARIGVLVPFTNSNLEPDLGLMRPDGVSFHFARMGGYDSDEIPDETQMQGLGSASLDETLPLLMGVMPDVVLYGCTSATLTHGQNFDRSLAQKIRDDSGIDTVTAAGALVSALNALGVLKIGFASPYVQAINDMAARFLTDAGFEIVSQGAVSETLDNEGQGAMTPEEVFELARRADNAEAQAVVLSCTDMRSVEAIAWIEAELHKPVVCSNQAMMFAALQFLGIKEAIAGFGQLLETPR